MKMKLFIYIAGVIVCMLCIAAGDRHSRIKTSGPEPLLVHKCHDFDITGDGRNPEWDKASWTPLAKLDTAGKNYETRFRILYSETGIYLIFYGEDDRITTKFDKDFEDLFKGDVFEVFFHPDIKTPLYLEYEVNPLNRELVLLIPHLKDRMFGWIPWHYEKERLVKKMVNITGGKMEAGASVRSWTAELFFPYSLFRPLNNVPPVSGTEWNANFYRLDYDTGKTVKWAWTPIKDSFHEFEKFQSIRFE